MERYFLGRDDAGHWYLVNADFRQEWNEWVDQLYAFGPDHETPGFATRLDCSPNNITFADPLIPLMSSSREHA